jgi:predicted aldo/keto reductase-like oxidoreductase
MPTVISDQRGPFSRNVALAAQGNFNQRMHTFLIRRRYGKKPRNAKQLEKRPGGGAASLCTECKACIKKCPQGLDVPTELKKVHAVLGKGEKVDRYLPSPSGDE